MKLEEKLKLDFAKEQLKECKDCIANDGKCQVQAELLDIINKFDETISCKSCHVKFGNEEYGSNKFVSFLFDAENVRTTTSRISLTELNAIHNKIHQLIVEFKGEM